MSNPYTTFNRISDAITNNPYITPARVEDTIFQPGHVHTGYATAKSVDSTPSAPLFHKDADVIRYVEQVLFNNGLRYKLEVYNRDTGYIDTIARGYSSYELLGHPKPKVLPEAVRFHFCGPATVVEWSDGTKTVVKCGEEDTYDAEKGIALCIVKKVFGNTGKYYDVIKKGLKEYEAQCEVHLHHLEQLFPEFVNFLKRSTSCENPINDASEDSQNGENSTT